MKKNTIVDCESSIMRGIIHGVIHARHILYTLRILYYVIFTVLETSYVTSMFKPFGMLFKLSFS